MENKTAEELKQLRTQIIKKHLSFVEDGTDEMKLIFAYHSAMEEYASIKLAEKDKEIDSFAIGLLTWLKNNCSHKYVISDPKLQGIRGASTWWYPEKQIWIRDESHLIELYKQSLNK